MFITLQYTGELLVTEKQLKLFISMSRTLYRIYYLLFKLERENARIILVSCKRKSRGVNSANNLQNVFLQIISVLSKYASVDDER